MKRLFALAQILFLRWTIHEAESYLKACETDGLVNSLALSEFRRQIARDRIRLYLLQPSRATQRNARTARKSWLAGLIGA